MDDLAGSSIQKRIWLLSQSFFGWPSNRPRLYTVLLRKGSGILGACGMQTIDKLYRFPQLSAKDHLIAPMDSWLGFPVQAKLCMYVYIYIFIADQNMCHDNDMTCVLMMYEYDVNVLT